MIDSNNPCVLCNHAFPDCASVCPKYTEYKCSKCMWSTHDNECQGQCISTPPVGKKTHN